jgi:hypothetical protein
MSARAVVHSLGAGGQPSMQCARDLRSPVEAYGCLVAPAVFNTDVVEQLDQAGSIPVRLRHRLAED